jgi:hypothetical protein
MSRNHPPDSNRRAALASGQKIDTPALVVLALTLFFATLFATLLVLRPEASDHTESTSAGSRATQSASRVNAPSVNAPSVNAPPVSAAPVSATPPSELPSKPIGRTEPKPEPEPDSTLQTQLEQLGIKCAKGANCYPD